MTPVSSASTPLAQYQPDPSRYDEYLDPSGHRRPAWQVVGPVLDRLGFDGLRACAAEARYMVHESDANFRMISDQQSRPWKLAIVPLAMDSTDWSRLEAGLQQRVRLLEATLADLLGPQKLLKQRVLPAELLSANPEFSRSYHELPVTGHRLSLTAMDLARNDEGQWYVTGDRTRAPSGLGYALENRIITSRVMPQLIRRSNVTRLASFFASLQQHLNSLAPRMRDNPRVAIMTPGKASYRYMEDAYLARYLGYTMVQGRDLAVRGNRLNLKTLGGLLPIEVVWRHVSDSLCDPLELDPHSSQGVTGLLQSIRDGVVAVTNSIGSSLAQMPALLPYMEEANRFFFGDDLLLPSIPTLWCGSTEARRRVLEQLDDWLIRPAFVVSGKPPIEPSLLSQQQRGDLIDQIKARPHHFVAQKRPTRSMTPVWHEDRLHSWHVAFRSFQLQTSTGVEVLPGGLVRVSPDTESLDHSPSSGRLGQDCWIVSDQPVDHEVTLLPAPGSELRLVRGGNELPSRVAENLFWLGRYAERSEVIARVLRTSLVRISGENDVEDLPDLPRLLAALAAMGQIEPDYAIQGLDVSMPTLEYVLPQSVFDRDQPQGLQAGVVNMVDKAAEVRDRISLDAYRIINRIGDNLVESSEEASRDMGTTIERVNRLITDLIALSGLANEGMTRTHGWRFLQLGRRIERAYQTSELLAATLVNPIADERPLLESLLRATDSLMTYRSRYLLQLRAVAAIDLLVNDDTNPRSIAFQIESIKELLDRLPATEGTLSLGPDQRIAETLLHRIRMSDPNILARIEQQGRRELDRLLQQLIQDLPKLSNAITARYLIHTSAPQELTGRVDTIVADKPVGDGHP
jgi:uncharacterized circularly permuted ATP-grasp superfamily protein/uncharacterized alpha-E superfamily protein